MIVMYLFESQNASFKKHVGVSLLKKQTKTHTLFSGSSCGSSLCSVVFILVEIMKVTSNSSEQFKQDPLIIVDILGFISTWTQLPGEKKCEFGEIVFYVPQSSGVFC